MSVAGRLLLASRLARGDLRSRPLSTLLLALLIVTTTATITLALALHNASDQPFARTRAATKGPDVAALYEPGFHGSVGTLTQFLALRRAPLVTAASGPYPVARLELVVHGERVRAYVEGRTDGSVSVDQPLLTAGRWASSDGIVLERSFANALGARIGQKVRIAGRVLTVRGIAVTAAIEAGDPFAWVTPPTLSALAGHQPAAYGLSLRLSDPSAAPNFVAAHEGRDSAWQLLSWQELRSATSLEVSDEQRVLNVGVVLLALVAFATIAVVVGGRMSDQARRVGLLKAVGGTSRQAVCLLLAENLLVTLLATVAGVGLGVLVAPSLTAPTESLLGSGGTAPLTVQMLVLVPLVAVALAALAVIRPALTGARTSTIKALTDPARPPSRHPALIACAARMPVPLLLATRMIARRPRRTLLGMASIGIAVASVVAAVTEHHAAVLGTLRTGNPLAASRHASLVRVDDVLSAMLITVAAINILFATWVSVLDARRPTALARALGATVRQVTLGLAAAQLAPALAAAIVGIPVGLMLFTVAGGNVVRAHPPGLWLASIVPATLLFVAALTLVPAKLGANRPIADVLRAE